MDKNWWAVPFFFCVEIITGLAIFTIIAAAALLLNYLIRYLELQNFDGFIIWGLKIAEYSVFLTDLVLFFRFLWRAGQRTWRLL